MAEEYIVNRMPYDVLEKTVLAFGNGTRAVAKANSLSHNGRELTNLMDTEGKITLTKIEAGDIYVISMKQYSYSAWSTMVLYIPTFIDLKSTISTASYDGFICKITVNDPVAGKGTMLFATGTGEGSSSIIPSEVYIRKI